MEVALHRRRLQKHLEPARPLRRFNMDHVPPGVNGNADTCACAQTLMQVENQENITVEQFCNIIRLHKQKPQPGRISYSREFLIELASSPVAKEKPELLPEHPVVLEKAREPHMLHEMGKESHEDPIFG